ncbi:restriction endonuclease [Sphaerisporangium fuscum]|uniref:restriction endonuclease n=1 Tax=Sphaerisporangium fuscum TaxID=2835868 RepID=UPI001BDD6BD3|nr:restriction endonuclease [Sphaerisporangium fuscum]
MVAVLFTALLLFDALRALIELLLGHWYLAVAATLTPAGLVAGWLRWKAIVRRRQAERLAHLRLDLVQDIDKLSPTVFEYAICDLMIRDGIEAVRVGGADDKAADVIGRDRNGRVIVVQCKHTLTGAKVAAKVIYQVNGTAQHAHGADVAIVVTNGSFTRNAAEYAAKVGIHLIDRDALRDWAQRGVALHELLKLSPVRRGWSGQRGRLRWHRRSWRMAGAADRARKRSLRRRPSTHG